MKGSPKPIVQPVYCSACARVMNPDVGCLHCTPDPTHIERGIAQAAEAQLHADETSRWRKRTPGVYQTITMEQYHAAPSLSKTKLDLIEQSVDHYTAELKNPTPATPAMTLGTMIHEAATEPDRFKRWRPFNGYRRGKAYNEFKARCALEAERTGVPVRECSREFYDVARRCRDSLLAHPVAGELIGGPHRFENSALVDLLDYPTVGPAPAPYLQGRCRPDVWIEDRRTIVDLKSSRSAKLDQFQRDLAKFRYHVSGAWYCDVWEAAYDVRPEMFVLVVVETAPPHPVGVYVLEDRAMDLGREDYRKDIDKLYKVLTAEDEEDRWTGYNEGRAVFIDLPGWMYHRRS